MKIKKISFRKLFYNNKFVAVFSLILSFFLWLKIASGSSEISKKTISNIPINVDLSSSVKEIGLSVFGLEDMSAEVTVSGNRIVLGQLTKDNIQIYANLSEGIITTAGNYTLELKARRNINSVITDFNFESDVSPRFINVFVDRFKSKTFNIIPEISYKTDPEYFTPINLSENTVTISGPDSIISTISKVCIESKLESQVTQTVNLKDLPIKLYDNNGNKIISKNLNYSTNKVNATISFLRKKNLKINPVYINGPNTMPFTESSIKLTPTYIDIAAPENVINSLDKIELDPLDFSQINLSNNSFDIPINMPNDCRNLSNTYSANIKINMSGIQSKKLNINKVSFVNIPSGKHAASSTINLNVEVLGPASEIKKISSDDITVQVDLSSKNNFTGTTEVPAKIIFNSSKSGCWSYGSYTINAEIT